MLGINISKDWHSKSKFNEYLYEYHNKHACQHDMSEAQTLNQVILAEMERELREKNLCTELLYSGDTYENLKLGRNQNDLEFDIMMIIGNNTVEIEDQANGFTYLKASDNIRNWELAKCIEGKYINPIKLTQKFKGIIQSIINDLKYQESFFNKFDLKLQNTGTALQLDVYKSNNKANVFYSVDFLPTFKVFNKYYIAKPQEGDNLNWSRSFNVEERSIFNSIDVNNGYCKILLKVIGKIFKNEATLKALTFYLIKTVMMNLTKHNDNPGNWKYISMFMRFIDYLNLLHTNLKYGQILHRFLGHNILKLNEISLQSIRDMVANLLNNEDQMFHLLIDADKRLYSESKSLAICHPYHVESDYNQYNEENEDKDLQVLKETQEGNDSFSFGEMLAIGVGVGALAFLGYSLIKSTTNKNEKKK